MRLHFSLGPVQGFVNQSRRTRDLWASSWLLSWLSGKAMEAALAVDSGAILELPALDKSQLTKLIHQQHAALPNRFVVSVEDGVKAGKAATAAVHEAWRSIADAVWREFVVTAANQGCGTEAIWERQIDSFWEVTWAVGGSEDELAHRKQWRTPCVTIEPGDHCTLMPQWQELSGYVAATGRTARDRQQEFWRAVRERSGLNELDFDDRERLCAIALIKRLFPRLSEGTQREIFGDSFAARWPSTTDLAAEAWRQSVITCASLRPVAEGYAQQVYAANPAAGQHFASVHGNYLIESALANRSGTPLKDESSRLRLLRALGDLYRKAGSRPSPHYAIILADGDRIGAGLRAARYGRYLAKFTRALTAYGQKVPKIVQGKGGHCVYAGGDDVLALCNVPCALSCADALEAAFTQEFRDLPDAPTLSVAVLFIHYRLPFSDGLRAVHALLDEVAKERTGRASLAIALHKHSGPAAQFSAPWTWWRRDAVDGKTHLGSLPALVDSERDGQATSCVRVTPHYVYKVGRLLEGLQTADRKRNASGAGFIKLDPKVAGMLPELLTAELLVGRGLGETGESQVVQCAARDRVKAFLPFCRQIRRDAKGVTVDGATFSLDGLRLAVFLSGAGVEVA